MEIALKHKEIVEKNFIVKVVDRQVIICGVFAIVKEDLIEHVDVANCAVCGSIVELTRVLQHSVWHESLVYKNDD
jgi:hypothetical protein